MRGPRITRRRLAVAVPAAVVAAVGGGALLASSASGDDGAAAAGTTGTATVAKMDLAERETVSGTLGYDDPRSVVNAAQGTITRVADEGATVGRGGVLYRVDEEPVRLMYGRVPAYRTLQSGVEGLDVQQLESNLRALGHDEEGEMTIDREWDGATTAAVERWQDATGAGVTGRVESGQVVFLPGGRRRVAGHEAAVGQSARPGQPVMTTTLTARAVTVDLDARRTDLLEVGRDARVTLPSGRRVEGSVTEVGATATPAAGGSGAPTIAVTVALGAGLRVQELDSAPVDVEIAGPTEEDALVVPITALLAVEGGGYGVEVVDADGDRRIVRVEPGISADGRVAVTGDVAEGETVVTAS